MANNIKYIAKYQKANTTQVNVRLNKKYDKDILDKLNSLDNEGKGTYIKRLIRDDMAREKGEIPADAPAEAAKEPEVKEDSPDEKIEDKSLSIAELAVTLGSSMPTISAWYRWKRQNPEHERAKLLPDFFRVGPHRERRWHLSDVPRLMEFKNTIPQGRNGVMGSVTQKYYKNSRWHKGNAA